MLKHNSYFENKVQSIGFERNGRRHTVGAIDPGEYRFETNAAERMTVLAGELTIKPDGDATWSRYPAGTTFEVAARSGFEVRVSGAPAAYWCEYL